jgi:hypothetical protein
MSFVSRVPRLQRAHALSDLRSPSLPASRVTIEANLNDRGIHSESGCLLCRKDMGRLSAREQVDWVIALEQPAVVAERFACKSNRAPNGTAGTIAFLECHQSSGETPHCVLSSAG